MVEKNKIISKERRWEISTGNSDWDEERIWEAECEAQSDDDYTYYATPEGAGYQKLRREMVEGFVKWLKEPCLHRDGSFPDPIHVPPEARLPRFKCRDCIDSLLKSPTVTDNWLDRPDKAGTWWVNSKLYQTQIVIKVHNGVNSLCIDFKNWNYTIDDFIENVFPDAKFLFQPEPTPPEGR